MKMDFAKPQDLPALKRLWRQVFQDTESYIDNYFNYLYNTITVAVCRDTDGQPIAMLSMLPTVLAIDGKRFAGHYLYAAATDPAKEGQGVMTRLLAFALASAKEAGDTFSCLVPASGSLFDFYGKRGYLPFFTRQRIEWTAPQRGSTERTLTLSPMEEAELFSYRTGFLNTLPVALHQHRSLYPYLHREMQETGFAPVRVTGGGADGVLICKKTGDLLQVKETTFSLAEWNTLAPALSTTFGVSRISGYFPADRTGDPYGMICPLAKLPDCTQTAGYMGLMMD